MRYTLNRDALLQSARKHLTEVRNTLEQKLKQAQENIGIYKEKVKKLAPPDLYTAESLLKKNEHMVEVANALYPSPYFIKCRVQFDNQESSRIFYFSKFALAEEHIYSWTSPAAVLRFQEPGSFAYASPDGTQKGTLQEKEQYLITDGAIVFMAAESTSHARQLVYQEHFSKRKTEFILPEIVEQMEAAQDKAIRTPPSRSLLIAGPAGSGKTTLALHRVAYLLQSPDTAQRFTAEHTLVLVNDHGTQKYFAALLPELGITNVTITTFADFVIQNLGLHTYSYQAIFGATEYEQNTYAYEKNIALQSHTPLTYSVDPWSVLEAAYAHSLAGDSRYLLRDQESKKVLDRFDVTILLRAYLTTHGGLTTYETEYVQLKGGKVKRTKKPVPKQYSLIILDEVQNYLPEQIELTARCLSPTGSCVYVGDLAQQTKLFTIRSWEQVGQQFSEENTVRLEKVYRSTKQILQYIQSQGFSITVPEQSREGKPVTTSTYSTHGELEAYIAKIITEHPDVTVGILSPHPLTVAVLAEHYKTAPKVKVLSISEAQGVEFDVVILCNTQYLTSASLGEYEKSLAMQIQQVNRDLLYVALTRAMNELYIIDKAPSTK